MKKSKKYFLQTGFSRIVVIVGVVIVVFVLGAVLLGLNKANKSNTVPAYNQQAQPSSQFQGETGFDKVEDASYIFYYPKGYVQGEPLEFSSGKKSILNYENANTKAVEAESIFLRVDSIGGKLSARDYEFCNKYGEQFRQKEDDEITAEVVAGGLGDGKGVGCKIIKKSKITGVDDGTIIVAKHLHDPQDIQGTIYEVLASYYANASKDQAERLNFAVDQFTLK